MKEEIRIANSSAITNRLGTHMTSGAVSTYLIISRSVSKSFVLKESEVASTSVPRFCPGDVLGLTN